MEPKSSRDQNTLINNRYKIMGTESVGALAVIYEAFDQFTTEPVVITAIRKRKTDGGNSRYPLQRLRADASYGAKLTHPDILHAYDQFEDDEFLYLVAQFAGFPAVPDFNASTPRPDVADIIRAMQKVVYAVEYFHSNKVFGCCIGSPHIRLSFGGEVKIDDFITCRLTYLAERGDAIARSVLEDQGMAARVDLRLAGLALNDMIGLLPKPFVSPGDRFAHRIDALLRMALPVIRPMAERMQQDAREGGYSSIQQVSEAMRELDERMRAFLRESAPTFSPGTKRRQFAAGEVIFREGDPPNGEAFIVERGVIQISKLSPDGRDIYLDVSKAGEIVGEMALIDNQPRMATARALEPTTLVVVSGREFTSAIERMNTVGRRLVDVLVGRLRYQAKEVTRLKALIGIKR